MSIFCPYVGIESTTRATLGKGLAVSAFSALRARLASPIAHVSVSPPLIPDGRISRVRLAAAACPQRTFPNSPRLKRSLVYSPGMIGYTSSSTSSKVVTVPWLSVQTVFPMRRPLLTESPFASDGCYPTQGGVAHLLGEHYPSFIAPTGSCAGPRPSHIPRLSLRQWVFAGCSKPCWEMALPGVISANLSPDAWTYTPAVPLVPMPVTSQRTSAFAMSGTARHSTLSVQRLPYGRYYGAAVIL